MGLRRLSIIFFTYAHATFKFEDKTVKEANHSITLHAYYNRHGVLINFNAMETKDSESSLKLDLNKNLERFIREMCDQFSATIIVELLEEKNNAYLALRDKSLKIEREIAVAQLAFEESRYENILQKELAIAKIKELLEVIEDLNSYDGLTPTL